MDGTIAIGFVLISFIGLIAILIKYNTGLMELGGAVSSVQRGLTNIRIVFEFVSFEATVLLLLGSSANLIKFYNITGIESIFIYLILAIFSILLSAFISFTTISTERVFGELGLHSNKIHLFVLTYIILATLNFTTLSIGGADALNSISKHKIENIKSSTDSDVALVKDNKKSVSENLNKQIAQIQYEIDNIDIIDLPTTKEIEKRKKAITHYEKNNKACPKTRHKLSQLLDEQKRKYKKELVRENNTLMDKMLKITDSYEDTSSKEKSLKLTKIEQIKKDNESNKIDAYFFALAIGLVGLFISYLLGSMNNVEEIEEVVEVEEEPKIGDMTDNEKKRIVEAAVRTHARRHETRIIDSEIDSSDFKLPGYSRNNIGLIARLITSRGIQFQWKDKNINQTKEEYIKVGGYFRKWLAGQEWNNKHSYKSQYYNTDIANEYMDEG